MAKQRISYVPLEKMDAAMRAEMERCAREGTPRPESTAVRAHVKACFWFFANSWHDIFRNGVLDHALKELCRVYVSRSVVCEFCGNQRSIKGANEGLQEAHYDDLINFEKSVKYDDRQKAALAYVSVRDAPSLVALLRPLPHYGQQSWLRLLNIEHHQVMAGTAASMAPGFETPEALAKSKASPDYWARKDAAPKKSAA